MMMMTMTTLIYNAEIQILQRETMTTTNQENMFLHAVRKKKKKEQTISDIFRVV